MCNAGRSLLKLRSRRRAVRFARMNGNLCVTLARNGQRSNNYGLLITTVSKTKQRSFWALAQNRNLRSGNALCSCNRPKEIYCGIALLFWTTRPLTRSMRAAASAPLQYHIRITIRRWSNGARGSTPGYFCMLPIASGSCGRAGASNFGKAKRFRFGTG